MASLKPPAVAAAEKVFGDDIEPKAMVNEPVLPHYLLALKLAGVMAAVGNVPKNGYNDFQRYRYVMESDLVEALSRELAKRHVIVLPSVVKVSKIPLSEKQEITRVRMRYTIIDGDNPDDSYSVDAVGEAADTADKGIYKAITGATKYFLMKTFLVSTGDDPEADTRTDKLAASEPGRQVNISQGSGIAVEKGGRTVKASAAQIRAISDAMKKWNVTPADLAFYSKTVLDKDIIFPADDPEQRRVAILAYLKELTGEEIAQLLVAIEELPQEPAVEEVPLFPELVGDARTDG